MVPPLGIAVNEYRVLMPSDGFFAHAGITTSRRRSMTTHPRTRRHAGRSLVAAGSIALAITVTGCDAAKDKAVDKALSDSGVELNDLGKSLPDSFPSDVPTPGEGVTLETAVATGDTFAMRYGVSDPAAAAGAYQNALEAAGYTIDITFDNLADAGNNVGFVASNGSWEVSASAFGEDPVDGLYMGVTVMPA
jgi:hypothetical protein